MSVDPIAAVYNPLLRYESDEAYVEDVKRSRIRLGFSPEEAEEQARGALQLCKDVAASHTIAKSRPWTRSPILRKARRHD